MKKSKRTFWQILFGAYLVLLIISYGVQWVAPDSESQYPGEEYTVIQSNAERIELRYIFLPGTDTDDTIIMVPDLLRGVDDLLPLAQKINRSLNRNILIPKYPEDRSRSNREKAKLIQILTDSLGIQKADLVGYGYGGLVAIDLAVEKPAIVRSVALLSSFGVIELQFLGNHAFNRSLYTLLYPVLAVYKYAVPHMGHYHHQPRNFRYVSTLRKMDQRPIRDQLQKLEQPSIILHPLKDRFVPLSLAEETHRLLPQSSLITHEADHTTIKYEPDVWCENLAWFYDLLDRGEALSRNDAHIDRINAAEQPFDAEEMRSIAGRTVVLLVLLLAMFTLISEDLACISAGLLAASGILPFWYAVLGCYIGILFADIGVYILGRWIGSPILHYRPFKWFIKKQDVERAKRMFKARGMEIIFVTRFLPGTRLPTYLVAGILKTRFLHFVAYFVIAISLWVPFLVGLSALVGQPMITFVETYQEYAIWIFLVLVLFIYLLYKLILPLLSVTGRRRLYVKWGRFKERHFGD